MKKRVFTLFLAIIMALYIIAPVAVTTQAATVPQPYSIRVVVAAGSAITNRAEFYTTGNATVQSASLASGSDPALYNSAGSRIADDEAGASHFRYSTVSGTRYYAGTYGNTAASYTITSTAPITLVRNGSGGTTNNDFAREVFRLTNIERANNGLRALIWDDRLASAAQKHSADMARNNNMSHTGSDGSSMDQRISREGFSWSYCGENVAWNQRTPQEVVQAWMNSPGHRANILSSNFTHLGVGFDSYYWTQNFATPR
ncbi:MAG: CAP domain-containing protein [Eubacteriaceae bacterium]|nr:CAP domain-containing protein [Eubacteriaceae bacterium]